MPKSGPPQIKKVRAYPFDASIEGHGKKANVFVMRITMQGMIADVGANLIMVGEEFQVALQLPTMKKWVRATAKVMKTYDQFKAESTAAGHVERMAEFQFMGLSPDHRANIQNFITAIKQI